jgi:hypothetical protein
MQLNLPIYELFSIRELAYYDYLNCRHDQVFE